jgi:hypothetical protein
MRQLGTTGGVLLAVASLTLAACGSSTEATPPSPTRPTATGSGVTSITKPDTTGPNTSTTVNPAGADAIAQFALTASLSAAKQTYDDTYDYTAVTPESIAPMVPSVHYAPLDQAAIGVVGVLAQTKHDVLFVTKSASGRWYCITENNEDGTSYGVGTSLATLTSNGECQLDAWPASG